MKKKIAIILAALMLLSVVPFTAVAGPVGDILENDPVMMKRVAPTLDGVISDDEGWSDPAYLDYDQVGFSWRFQDMTTYAELYFAYDDNGLYFAADVTEDSFLSAVNEAGDPKDFLGNTFVLSTGYDDLSNETEEVVPGSGKEVYPYGYNGDIVALTLDPHCVLINKAGLTGNADRPPQYNIGLFEGEEEGTVEARVYLTYAQSKELTGEGSEVKAAATLKDEETRTEITLAGREYEAKKTGAQMEIFIPWTQIYDDMVYVSLLDEEEIGFTAEDLAKSGSVMRAAVTYMDRFYDEEGQVYDNWGRFITVCAKTKNGLRGNETSQTTIDSLGLTLVNDYNNPFTDVGETQYKNETTNVGEGTLGGTQWFTEAALWCNEKGLMTGTTATTFAPNVQMTRAQIALILAKLSGDELSDYEGAFSDVAANHWAAKGIQWAVANNVTKGTGDGSTFSPDAALTRETLAVFFRAYAEHVLGADVSIKPGVNPLIPFDDADKISTWAIDAVKWAVENKLISGTSATTVSPNGTATRSQVAVIIKSFALNFVANAEK